MPIAIDPETRQRVVFSKHVGDVVYDADKNTTGPAVYNESVPLIGPWQDYTGQNPSYNTVIYNETFDTTTYDDTSNTTANGWGTGSLVFSGNQVATSLVLPLPSTNIETVTLSPIVSNGSFSYFINTSGTNFNTGSMTTTLSGVPTHVVWNMNGNGSGVNGVSENVFNLSGFNISFVTGKLNQGVEFNGSGNSYMVHGGFVSNSSAQQSFTAWVYPYDFGTRNVLFSYSGTMYLNLETTGQVRLFMNSVAGREFITPGSIPLNQWSHITAVIGNRTFNASKQPTDAALYINGSLQAVTTAVTGSTSTTSSNLYLGALQSGVLPFSGIMDDVRFYNFNLTQPEIDFIYNSGSGTETLLSTPFSQPGIVGEKARRLYGMVGNVQIGTGTDPDYLLFDYTQSFTFSCWVKPLTNVFSGSMPIMGRNFQQAMHITRKGDNAVNFLFGVRVGGTALFAPLKWGYLNQWHHVVGVYDAASRRVYLHLDGIIDTVGTDVSSLDFVPSAVFRIGDSAILNGDIVSPNIIVDETRIYKKALSSDEVSTLWNKGDVVDGLVAKYSYEEEESNVIFDTSSWSLVTPESPLNLTPTQSNIAWKSVERMGNLGQIDGIITSGTGFDSTAVSSTDQQMFASVENRLQGTVADIEGHAKVPNLNEVGERAGTTRRRLRRIYRQIDSNNQFS